MTTTLLRVSLTADQRAQLRARLGQRTLAPRTRRRLECVRLSDRGWTVAQIAEHLEVHHNTVRRTLHRFVRGGLDGLVGQPRSGRPPQVSSADVDAVCELLDQAAAQGQTWTLPQLRGWLRDRRGVTVSARAAGGAAQRARVLLETDQAHGRAQGRSARQQQAKRELAGLQQPSSRPAPA
jgi:transposase